MVGKCVNMWHPTHQFPYSVCLGFSYSNYAMVGLGGGGEGYFQAYSCGSSLTHNHHPLIIMNDRLL